LGDLGQRGASALFGGVIGYAIGAVANPFLTAHNIPTLPESVTTPIGAWLGDKLTLTIRTRYDAVIERRRTKKVLNTLQTLSIEARDLSMSVGADPTREQQEVMKAQQLLGDIEALRASAMSERGEFTVEKLEQAVDDYSEQVRAMTTKSRTK